MPYLAIPHGTPAPPGVSHLSEPDEDGMVHGYLSRVFIPCENTNWRDTINPETLVRYNPTLQISNYLISRTEQGPLYPRQATIVVSVDGACRGNGTINAQASFGVCFGPGSQFNVYGCLPQETFDQTNQVAEIVSCLVALEKIKTEVLPHVQRESNHHAQIKQVVLVTDSEYLVRSMSEYIWRWLQNGWVNSKRARVKNHHLLLRVHESLQHFQQEMGMDVRFWRVNRRFNKVADALANEALDSRRMYHRSI